MNMLLSLLYELGLYFLALVALPRILYLRLTKQKYKESLSHRFGADFPFIQKDGKKLIWMHAVSVGETKAIAKLAKQLKEKNDCLLLISSITETGHAEAKRSISFADYHVYLPFDFRWLINPIVKQAAPNVVILSETDFWYNFLAASKKIGAHIALVNGKLSMRSLERFKQLNFLSRHLFKLLDLFCVQNELYRQRFLDLGILNEKIVITGNMKFDEEYPVLTVSERQQLKNELGITSKDPVLVIGSTHDPEESLILKSLEKVWEQFPSLKVILVPRHPERFTDVADLLRHSNIPFIRFSERFDKHENNKKVILVDTMGFLRTCYQLADLSIVAGSYTERVGGHNVIEPCAYGIPAFFGPYTHTQTELVSLVSEYKAGFSVPIESLSDTLITYLQDPKKRLQLGEAGKKLHSDMQGATKKTLHFITTI